MPPKQTPFWLQALLLLALIVPPHLAGIDRFATLDEPWWVISGSNFYYAITHRDFANTVYDYHPAVTTTWVVTAGMLTVFPEYRGLGQGYFDVRKPNFDEFLAEHGKYTLDLLRNSRILQSLLLFGLALVLFYLLRKFMDGWVALFAAALAFDAPFFLGHSRLLNHEGMLTMFVVVSVAAMFAYLQGGRKLRYLLISGAAFGLAQLTKSPSILVAGVVGLMLLVGMFQRGEGRSFGKRLLDALRTGGIWLLAAALVYVALWPGMWVAPGKMLYEVYGNAFSYAFQGARLDVTQDLPASAPSFSPDTGIVDVGTFLSRLAMKSTPVTWIGLALFLAGLFTSRLKPQVKALSGYLLLTAALFIVMFAVAQGRDSSHYILTSFYCVDLAAAFGWAFGLEWLGGRFTMLGRAWAGPVLMLLLLGLHFGAALPSAPYYYTYINPFFPRTVGGMSGGYGEGLDRAAAYLAKQPDATNLKVYAYAGMGPFSYFFPGKTEVMKKVHFLEPGLPDVVRGMRWSDYVVVYAAYQDRYPEFEPLRKALEGVAPEKVIMIQGQEYVRIYRTVDVPEQAYTVLEQFEP